MIFFNSFKKSPLLAKIKFEPTFFQVLWRFAFPLPLQGEAGGRGVWEESVCQASLNNAVG